MFFQIILLLVLTGINALFAMAEMALVSVRRSRLEELAESGNLRAKVALEILDSPETFLSTVQTGVTMIGILSGAVGGATLAVNLSPYIAAIPYLSGHASYLSFGLVVLTISYMSLILGELVPKRWALAHSESIALMLAIPLRAASVIGYPLVMFFSRSAELVTRFLRLPKDSGAPVSEEEIRIMLEHGEKAGVVEEVEKEMIERVFRLGDKRVDSLMTHRTDIVWIDSESTGPEMLRTVAESGHSRFPVCRETIDDVIGIVDVKDIMMQNITEGSIDLKKVTRKALIVPGTIGAFRVLEKFRESQNQTALVVDEYGSLDGIVTVSDVMEAILGQLPGPGQETDPEVVEREDGSLLIDGTMSFDEFEDLLNISISSEENGQKGDFQTLAGFIISHLGRFPGIGERFEWSNHVFEIVDMDGHRIDRVLVTPPASSGAGESPQEQRDE